MTVHPVVKYFSLTWKPHLAGIIFFQTTKSLFLENVRQEHLTFFSMWHQPCDSVPSLVLDSVGRHKASHWE